MDRSSFEALQISLSAFPAGRINSGNNCIDQGILAVERCDWVCFYVEKTGAVGVVLRSTVIFRSLPWTDSDEFADFCIPTGIEKSFPLSPFHFQLFQVISAPVRS
ncbi:unnamed protein product [Onchocerca flexuosa]|uniref:Uncharacterized protein n=1 Tax=Onchocerca flexuosa TaxID=387005 RepID=A0A183HJ63_9BILA|nr:unnamed protein product [Onchocerca flexuosa]